MERLLKWIEWPIHLMLWIGLVAGGLMMLHVTTDVTARTVFNSPLPGTNEIVSGYYMVVTAYLPWAYIARDNSHIQVEMFTRLMPRRVQFWLSILAKVLTIAYVSLFTWETYIRAVQQTRLGEVWQIMGGFIPIWPSRWLLPLAGGLMVIYLILRTIDDLARANRPPTLTGASL